MSETTTVLCPHCAKPALPDYPHHHETPPRPDYDPMPVRPLDLSELLAIMRGEYLDEIPVQLHVAYVPGRPEPIGVSEYSAAAAGYVASSITIEVLDTGALGSPSWSPAFHNYVGAVTGWGDAVVLRDADLAPFPWVRQLEGVRRWCSSKHLAWYEHQGRPLCWTLLRHLVIGGYSLGRAANLEGISVPTATRLVDAAARKWWGWVSNDLNAIEIRRRRPPAA